MNLLLWFNWINKILCGTNTSPNSISLHPEETTLTLCESLTLAIIIIRRKFVVVARLVVGAWKYWTAGRQGGTINSSLRCPGKIICPCPSCTDSDHSSSVRLIILNSVPTISRPALLQFTLDRRTYRSVTYHVSPGDHRHRVPMGVGLPVPVAIVLSL